MGHFQKLTGILPVALLPLLLIFAYQTRVRTPNGPKAIDLPSVILWAWERPEDLEFIDPRRFGVAFLAQTLILEGEDVIRRPRRPFLKVAQGTKLLAVTRIESRKITGNAPSLTPLQREKIVALILKTRELKNVSGIQVDFDAVTSERVFYRELLQDLRQQLPEDAFLSMTALASFCIGDRWLNDLPVDEAVPMVFRMGSDDKAIKSLLAGGWDFREPLCRKSYGIALDEPVKTAFEDGRRIYVFNARPWKETDLVALEPRITQ